MRRFLLALSISLLFCGGGPILVLYVIHDLPVTWLNIFLVGGIESFFVLMAVELGKWVKMLWHERNE